MAWVKLTDDFYQHPKVVDAGPAAAWVYVTGLCYSARYLTDGYLSPAAARQLAGPKDGVQLINRLVEVRLWDPAEAGGFRIHDYLVYNPPGAKVRADRARNADRQHRWRTGDGHSNGVSDDVTDDVTNDVTDDASHSPCDGVRATAPYPYPYPYPVPYPDPSPASSTPTATTHKTPVQSPSVAAGGSGGTDPDAGWLDVKERYGPLLAGRAGFRSSPHFWRRLLAFEAMGLPVQTELLRALDWLQSRKKRNASVRFLLAWLQEEVEQRGLPPAATTTADAPPAALATLEPEAPVAPDPETEAAAAAVWDRALELLAASMTRANFAVYLQGSRGLGLRDDTLSVGFATDFRRDTVEERFLHLIRRALGDMGEDLAVRLVVAP